MNQTRGSTAEPALAAQRAATEIAQAALCASDPQTAAHSDDVVTLCTALCERLGVSEEERDDVLSAARLHDIGKLAIPQSVLAKPGPLTESEWDLVRRHTVTGEQIARAVPELERAALLIRHSHEHWDGSGYPDGLAGEEIPIGSRIILCADAFHAIRSDRPYRDGRSPEEAILEIHACSGTQFDPLVASALGEIATAARNRAGRPRQSRLAALLVGFVLMLGGTAFAAERDLVLEPFDRLIGVLGGQPLPEGEPAPATTPTSGGATSAGSDPATMQGLRSTGSLRRQREARRHRGFGPSARGRSPHRAGSRPGGPAADPPPVAGRPPVAGNGSPPASAGAAPPRAGGPAEHPGRGPTPGAGKAPAAPEAPAPAKASPKPGAGKAAGPAGGSATAPAKGGSPAPQPKPAAGQASAPPAPEDPAGGIPLAGGGSSAPGTSGTGSQPAAPVPGAAQSPAPGNGEAA